jgi:hypothetical protein
MFRKPTLLPFSGTEAPNMVDPLYVYWAILSYWVPKKHSACYGPEENSSWRKKGYRIVSNNKP